MPVTLYFLDDNLRAALAPVQNFPTQHHWTITDECSAATTAEHRIVVLSRELHAALVRANPPIQADTIQGKLKFHHIVVVENPNDAPEAVCRAISRAEAFGPEPSSEPKVNSHLRMDGEDPPSPYFSYCRHTIGNRAQKVQALEDLVGFIEALKPHIARFSSHFVSFAIEIQEEMLSNAIWDANPRLSRLAREGDFQLSSEEEVVLEWGFDGKTFAIAATDPFGTFPETILPRYFQSLFQEKSAFMRSINREGPGAGLGLHMILQRAGLVSIALAPGKRTEIVASLDFSQGSRGLMRSNHSLQFIRISREPRHGIG